STQSVGGPNSTPETTYYQYDGKGKRLRKITENFAPVGTPTKKNQRIYIEGYEFFQNFSTLATTRTLSLIDEGRRFVMIENSSVSGLLTRYQHPNHQSSCTLETDMSGNVITYEEYHPFGTTSYQAKNNSITAAAKRYRFTGMERDDESGLNYHGARYYVPWLGRWMNADPIDIGDGANVYVYCQNEPVKNTDKKGTQIDPNPAFLASKLGKIYKKLRGVNEGEGNTTYNFLIKKFGESKYVESKEKIKGFKYSIEVNEKEVPPGINAVTGTNQTQHTNEKKEITIVAMKAVTFVSLEKLTKSIVETKDGKTIQTTYERSEISQAKTLIHEALHAFIRLTVPSLPKPEKNATKEEIEKYKKAQDQSHDIYSGYINKLVAALIEYNTENKLGYTKEQLTALAWQGVEDSAAFKTYLNDLAKKNKTTYEEEYKKWDELTSELTWVNPKEKEVKN
ncbi:MAG: RHS repeat-associated core domain-containing protein, partial [Bacteroidetes bacterium]|nr:RHS repeat-associated core domain-containing protein [Bacteroidota bacterium]